MIFTTAVIADIHFGAIRPDQLYRELEEYFLKFLKNHYVDMVIIAGDFFNSIIPLNAPSAINAFKLMRELVKIAEKNGIKYIRIIEGTLSHDNFQIVNFKMYENYKDIDFKLITKVTEETLDNGIHILYLPEEYMTDPIEYYTPYLKRGKKSYDFIFGHGMFKETSFISQNEEPTISKAPIWDSKYIGSITKGPVFFGHIHTSQVIRKHIYYTGSFSRWVYGQEEPKGFYIFSYDTETSKYLIDFIENQGAKRYDTITVHLDSYDGDVDKLVTMLRNYKKDHLRIQVLIESEERDYSYTIGFLKEYYAGKSDYKLEIIDKREAKKQEEMESKVNKLLTDYNFLFDKAIPVESKIHKFIKRKYQKEVSEEKIKELLNLDIKKVK